MNVFETFEKKIIISFKRYKNNKMSQTDKWKDRKWEILFPHTYSFSPYQSSVIHLQFWAYGSWDSLFPISMSPTANLWVQNTIFHDKYAIPLHPGTRWNKNFASLRQNYAQKMQDVQVKKSLVMLTTFWWECIFQGYHYTIYGFLKIHFRTTALFLISAKWLSVLYHILSKS